MKAKIFLLLFVLVAMTGFVSAVNLDVTSVEINNRNIYEASGNHTNNYKYERGEELEIDVCVKALAEVQDAQIEADIYGYRYSTREQGKVSDITNTFDLDEGDNDCFMLNLEVPTKMDVDYYKLRIRVADRDGVSFSKDFQLHIEGADSSAAIEIRDFSLDPEEVIAGRAFTAMVKVRNIGDNDLDDLKVTVSVPELNIKTSEYMDEIESDESKTFEELLLRIPECAKAGNYDVEILVEFDEYEETSVATSITVKSGDMCGTGTGTGTSGTSGEDKTIVTVPSSQELSQGTSIAYPIMIQNNLGTSKTYTLTVSGASGWATTRIDPSSVVIVPAGQSKTVYMYVSANSNAEPGDKIMTLTVDSGTESKQIPLVAKIGKGTSSTANWSGLRNGLEVGLVVLVIILIVIGLIIAFNKMRDNKKESEPYY